MISTFVYNFYKELYTSQFSQEKCDSFLLSVCDKVSGINEDFKLLCDSDLSITEMEEALKSMKRGKISRY